MKTQALTVEDRQSNNCPRSPSDRQLRASVKERLACRDYPGAIAFLNQLLDRHPDSAMDYNNRGLMYFYAGRLLEAIRDLGRAIALDSSLDSAYNNRANCWMAQGNLGAALADYERAIDLNPANLKAWINEGIALRDLGLYDLALENFDLVLALASDLQGRMYGERGRTYHLRGDWNCAIADYRRALGSLSPTHPYCQKVEAWLQELNSLIKVDLA